MKILKVLWTPIWFLYLANKFVEEYAHALTAFVLGIKTKIFVYPIHQPGAPQDYKPIVAATAKNNLVTWLISFTRVKKNVHVGDRVTTYTIPVPANQRTRSWKIALYAIAGPLVKVMIAIGVWLSLRKVKRFSWYVSVAVMVYILFVIYRAKDQDIKTAIEHAKKEITWLTRKRTR